MISIDVLNKDDTHIQISGDYKIVSYEISKIIASMLVGYGINKEGPEAVDSMLGVIIGMSRFLIPESQKQIEKTGTIFHIPKSVATNLRGMQDKENYFHTIFDVIDNNNNEEE